MGNKAAINRVHPEGPTSRLSSVLDNYGVTSAYRTLRDYGSFIVGDAAQRLYAVLNSSAWSVTLQFRALLTPRAISNAVMQMDLSHPSIVKCVRIGNQCAAFQYYNYQPLSRCLHRMQNVTTRCACDLVLHILSAIDCLHMRGYAVRNISVSNS
jgi:hypothetical protein